MKSLKHVLSLVLLALFGSSQGLDEQTCPCGYVGVFCNETGYVEEDSNKLIYTKVSEFPNGTCTAGNTDKCDVYEEKAFCLCKGGFKGDLCETRVEVNVPVLVVLGIGLPFLVSIVGGVIIHRHDKRTDGSDWDFHPDATVEGRAGKKVLLAYRTVILFFCLAVVGYQYHSVVTDGDWPIRYLYRFYTVINFHLLIFYFAVGWFLSMRAVFFQKEERNGKPSLLEKVFFVAMEVELPSTILICLVVWFVLYPPLAAVGRQSAVVSFTSFVQHAANVLFMFFDFLLNGLSFRNYHFFFVAIWGSIYLIYHNFIMLGEYLADIPHKPSYPFLSADSALLGMWIVGLLVVLVLFYFGTALGNRLKPPMRMIHDLPSQGSKSQELDAAEN